MRAIFLLAAVLLAGCHNQCSASNCTGCCDESGECQSGGQLLLCGQGGAQCGRCGVGEVCSEHTCTQAPDAGVVDAGLRCVCSTGCCAADGTCRPGNVPDECGPKGVFCTACGSTQRCEANACTSRACTGCLDATGACQTGTANDACGASGGLCESCLVDQSCRLGTCVATACSATTCATGCCDGSGCVSPPTTAECGIQGATCAACTGSLTCTAGVCQ